MDPEPFSPALFQIPRQPLDLNEILSLVSWIKDCSNYDYIYIYIHKLIMINYKHWITIRIHWKTFFCSSQVKESKSWELKLLKDHLRAKRGKMIISINTTNTNTAENGSAKLLLHELNTDQSQILTDFYSNWLPRTIRPNELSSFSLRRDIWRNLSLSTCSR